MSARGRQRTKKKPYSPSGADEEAQDQHAEELAEQGQAEAKARHFEQFGPTSSSSSEPMSSSSSSSSNSKKQKRECAIIPMSDEQMAVLEKKGGQQGEKQDKALRSHLKVFHEWTQDRMDPEEFERLSTKQREFGNSSDDDDGPVVHRSFERLSQDEPGTQTVNIIIASCCADCDYETGICACRCAEEDNYSKHAYKNKKTSKLKPGAGLAVDWGSWSFGVVCVCGWVAGEVFFCFVNI